MKKLNKILHAVIFCAFTIGINASTLEDVDKSFFPYKGGFPSAANIKAGMVINKDNADLAKDVLDPEMLQHVRDGWVEITVGESTDFILNEDYINASKNGVGKVTLGAQKGQLVG